MLRKKGISLAEVGLALGISTLLTALVAGAGMKMSNDSKAQTLVNRAKDVANAVEAWMLREGNSLRGPLGGAQYAAGGDITQLAKYMPNNSIFNPNPWTGSTNSTLSFFSTANNNYADAGALTSTGYPTDGQGGRRDCRGMIIVLAKGSASYSTLRVWDNSGSNYKTFQYYAVQAIDNRGYPAITLGK